MIITSRIRFLQTVDTQNRPTVILGGIVSCGPLSRQLIPQPEGAAA